MPVRISGKHMDVGESLSTRIEDRIDAAVDKYFGHGYSGSVVLEKEGNFFLCDCMLHLDSGVALQTSSRESDPTAAFDRACDRIEKRLRRYKRKLKDHHLGQNAHDQAAAYAIMSTPAEEEDEELPDDFAPVVIAESSLTLRTQTVAMAVMQLELMDQPVNIFKNAGNGALNIVYRRADGNIGWVDPSSAPSET